MCAFILTSGLVASAWFHNGSIWAWITGLVWTHIIDLTVEDEDEDDEEDEDEEGPDDPTPTGDAVEGWLQSLRRTVVSVSS